MPLLQTYTTPLRGIWQLTESSDTLLSMLERKEYYLSSLEKMTSERRKQEWLAARLLFRELTGEEKRICYLPNGAPYLPDAEYSISISHTTGYVAVLLQEKGNAGIDIEYFSERAFRLKERFLSPQELATLSPENEKIQTLLCWSAKEVLFKLMGEEGVDFREHLHLQPFSLAANGSIRAGETRTSFRKEYHLRYEVTSSFVWVWNEEMKNEE